MALSYNKLWKLLIDKGIKKSELAKQTGISQSTLSKIAKGENDNTDILERICIALKCEVGDIVELQNNLNMQGNK